MRCGRNSVFLPIFDAAAEAVQIALANQYVLVCLLEIQDDCVHPINRLLKGFEVRSNRHNIFIQSRYFKFMVLEIVCNLVFIGF